MDSGSDPLFPFNVFSPATFLSPASAPSASAPSASASDSPVAAVQKSRRKRSKLIKSTTDRLLAPSTSGAGTSKPKYAKKPDQTTPMITRPCSECGKQFWSWKALFGHMRCHPERQWRGINPPQNLRRSESTATDEDREIAACLIMLANGPNAIDRTEAVTETDDECREIQEAETTTLGQFVECAGPPSCLFECSSCKKVFGSHQALGGHRASHKNVKGCFAVGSGATAADTQCSICRKAFSSGYDHHHNLHHRRAYSSVGKELEGSGYLDLNLPPPMEDIEEYSSSYSSEIVLDLRLGLN